MRQWKGSRSFPDSCSGRWRQHQELRRGDPEGKVVQEEEEFEGPATRTMPPAAVKVSVYAWSPVRGRRQLGKSRRGTRRPGRRRQGQAAAMGEPAAAACSAGCKARSRVRGHFAGPGRRVQSGTVWKIGDRSTHWPTAQVLACTSADLPGHGSAVDSSKSLPTWCALHPLLRLQHRRTAILT